MTMKKYKLAVAFLAIIALLLMGCATLDEKPERAIFALPKGKELKHVRTFAIGQGGSTLTRFVFDGESISNYKEAFEIFNAWRKNYPHTPEEAHRHIIERGKKRCPEAIVNIISQDNNSILSEVKTVNCPPNPDGNSISRILYGNTNVFIFVYTNKVKDLPAETRDEWIEILSTSSIKTVD
jgi:hypothetical protein